VRAFAVHADTFPWAWRPQHVDDWMTDLLGGALALAGIALGLAQGEPPATAYSYPIEARRAFGSRGVTRAPAAARP
jgi:hypothetical protein